MVSDFRKKKFTYLFKLFFDCDGSRSVTKQDFDLMIGKITKAKGWIVGDEAYKKAEKTITKIWEGIQSRSDKNKDGEISLDEWISLWDDFSKHPSDPLSWQAHYCKAIFYIQDASGDGAIDEEEYVNVHVSFGAPKEDATKAFEKLVKGKTSISWEDFQKLWAEFFTSEEENAPGNFIFANLKF